MIINKFYTFIIIATVAIFSSCGGKDSYTSDSSADSTTVNPDSLGSMKRDTVAEQTKKEIKFATPEEALDFMMQSGHWESYESGILPRMAEENLEYCGKLLNNEFKYFIVADKATMKVILYSKYGNVVKEYGMACAKKYGTKHKKADSRTPEGYFTVEGIYDSSDWLFTNDNGYTSPARGQYGPRFIRLKTPVSSQIGIHGTSSPRSIGKRVSHGCMRILNKNILELAKYAQKGMPVIVSPGAKDMRVNLDEGYNIKAVTTGVSKVVPAEHNGTKKHKDNVKGEATDSAATPKVEKAEDTVKSDSKKVEKATEKTESPAEKKSEK